MSEARQGRRTLSFVALALPFTFAAAPLEAFPREPRPHKISAESRSPWPSTRSGHEPVAHVIGERRAGAHRDHMT